MTKDFLTAVKERRSIYALSNKTTIADQTITHIVSEVLLNVPTPFNIQGSRAVILFGEHHKALWSIVMETLRKIVPAANFASTEQKINSFKNGYGSILYFDNTEVTEEAGRQNPLYKDNFKMWAEQSNGMLQFAVWTALEIEGLGASLQHYNPLIDNEVKEHWKFPEGWKLIAQMPFGKPTEKPAEKTFIPIGERLKIFS